ncbi:hypothetical protein [Streptomyces liangshanensis]|uniref:hypothetical protein n=1 Tax=Streptomyces liangshanensis TaxID=2717324 RepID=UPI0036D78163
MSSPPDIGPHIEAVTAVLTGRGLVVGEGGAPNPIPAKGMYVALYFDPGQVGSESLADRRTNLALGFQATCVGPTAVKCLWVAQQLRVALFGPLTVAGRATWRPEELGGPPVQRDDDVSPPVYYLPVQYRLQSAS